ncbi:DNA (cytosine-5-)-methyltransferase [Gordonia sp. VNQ95]|jgi:DNA (cytosine-5)-methyltransferase 1|uniref:DNA cytosine methyltransferase n=1 Tax=Gordonia sp. VNQ95 TaxID=3156619 RepID=UPI0032B5A4F3
MRVVGLFSGIGGLEVGLAQSGFTTKLLCENWGPAVEVLKSHFDVPVVGDICALQALPKVDVVTAGFPCTDLSQVGKAAGIGGHESGLIREVFRLLDGAQPSWVVLENVTNMLSLHGGQPIRVITEWFDEHRWNWAYRIVDSQYFGVPQRRRRVLIVASRDNDPRTVLFADSHDPRELRAPKAHGFYWTEGNRGVGWGNDIVPTLKGGSKLGIPSPPAIWRKTAQAGNAIVRPRIEVGEQLQGFTPRWTDVSSVTAGQRWKMVGNAVTVPVAQWVGDRLVNPGVVLDVARPLDAVGRWPCAASSVNGERQAWEVTEAPLAVDRMSISELVKKRWEPLSAKATQGFYKRFTNSRLRAGGEEFKSALSDHIEAMVT